MEYAFQSSVLISKISINFPAPLQYPVTGSPYGAMGIGMPRSMAVADINGDGWLDIFIQPSYFAYLPSLQPIILLNDKKGGFFDGTATVFKGSPNFQLLNNVFFRDFNNDGRADLFAIDQGLELAGKTSSTWDGSANRLFIQDWAGFLVDQTATLANNASNFNHTSSMGDINGDGRADILLTQLGGPDFAAQGNSIHFGDGKGGFSFSLDGLPQEIRYLPDSQRQWTSTTIDYQYTGSNAIGDINADGRADLVFGSYLGPDQVSRQRTIRTFEQQPDGQFVQKFSISQPAALQTLFGPLGVSGLAIADLDGDARNDIVAIWENDGKSALQILRNLGDGKFGDVTESWLGSYLPREFKSDGFGSFQYTTFGIELKDFNHDGRIDLILKQYGISAAQLANGTSAGASIYLNDGTGRLSALSPTLNGQTMSAEQLATMTENPLSGLGVPLTFDANNDGIEDLVLLESFHNLNVSVFPYSPTTLHVSVLQGAESKSVYRAGDLGDTLHGSSGSDTFYDGKGSDKIFGGNGMDTLFYTATMASHKISASGGLVTIRGSGHAGSADTLSSVERVQFSDGAIALYNGTYGNHTITKNANSSITVSGATNESLSNIDRLVFADAIVRFDVSGVGGQAYRVYQAAFGRTPDMGGLGFWIGAMDQGASLLLVANNFATSAEFQTLYGSNPTNRDIVSKFYVNVLRREGDVSGVDFWTNVLDKKLATVAEVLLGFSESPENQTALVGVMENGIAYLPFG